MPTPRNITLNDMTRVWVMEDQAGPAVAPEYMGVWRAGAASRDYGEATAVEIPSDSAYGQFQEVASLPGASGKPTMGFTARYARSLSDMLRMARRECAHDFQVHIGLCQDLKAFNTGWDKVLVLEQGRISNYSTDELGALASDERAAVNETISVQGSDLYEIGKLSFAAVCAASVIQEVVGITFCDAKGCGGECGAASDGCQKFFAVVKAVGGSPGLGAQVVYSDDAGSTCGTSVITTLPANQDPNDIACVGDYVVVISEDSESWHYAETDELLLDTETWQELATGIVAGNGPLAIWALKPGYVWIVGENGYVYFMTQPTDGVTVQDAGSATTQNLLDVHAYDEENVLAVGAANACIHTTDGSTWTAVTGPAVGVNLNCCWMKSELEWWVGDAAGNLHYTRDAGSTWTTKAFTGSGAGAIHDIAFITKQVGYISHATATPAGRILRTIDGGYSWYVLPEATGSIPANDRINKLAGCGDPNLILGGGLADDAADGIIVKATA